jgi:hypothetical protein
MGRACSTYEWVRTRTHLGYWWEIREEREHKEDQDIGGWIILIWGDMDWIGLTQDKNQWRALVTEITNLWVP